MHLGFGASPTPDDDAGITGKSHQEIAGISHAARQNNRGGPIRWRHLIGGHDAKHQPVGLNCTLSSNSGCWTAAPAHNGDGKFGKRFTCLTREFVGARTGLSAAEYTNLGFSVRNDHGEGGCAI